MDVVSFFLILLLAACGDPMVRAEIPNKESDVAVDPASPVPGTTTSLTGTRLTMGNAVDCPQIRDAAGAVHTVSYLSPAVALGARVTVRGVYGITTTCLGTVLVVQQETILPE